MTRIANQILQAALDALKPLIGPYKKDELKALVELLSWQSNEDLLRTLEALRPVILLASQSNEDLLLATQSNEHLLRTLETLKPLINQYGQDKLKGLIDVHP